MDILQASLNLMLAKYNSFSTAFLSASRGVVCSSCFVWSSFINAAFLQNHNHCQSRTTLTVTCLKFFTWRWVASQFPWMCCLWYVVLHFPIPVHKRNLCSMRCLKRTVCVCPNWPWGCPEPLECPANSSCRFSSPTQPLPLCDPWMSPTRLPRISSFQINSFATRSKYQLLSLFTCKSHTVFWRSGHSDWIRSSLRRIVHTFRRSCLPLTCARHSSAAPVGYHCAESGFPTWSSRGALTDTDFFHFLNVYWSLSFYLFQPWLLLYVACSYISDVGLSRNVCLCWFVAQQKTTRRKVGCIILDSLLLILDYSS